MYKKPIYVPLYKIYDHILSDVDLCAGVVESFGIEGLQGYFISYDNIIKIATAINFYPYRTSSLEELERKFGGIPVSKYAIENIQKIAPELLPSEKPVQIDSEQVYEDIEVFEPRFDAIMLLNKVAKSDKELEKSNTFWIYETGREQYCHYIAKTNELLIALQSGMLEAQYYDPETSEMKSISSGLWHSEHMKILWKQGKVLLKGKYVECLITGESSEAFLATLPINNNKEFVPEKNAYSQNQTDFGTIKMLFADDQAFNGKITKENIENIKDSLSLRIFKLALICDSLDYRKATNETLADFIFHTQDWYFEGMQKTMSLAKKAASMIRSIDAAKGGVALDLRRYDPKTKKII